MQVERKSSKECSDSFLWSNESFSLWNCVSRNSTLFSLRRIRAFGLFWTKRRSEVSEEAWGTFCTPWSRKVLGNFCIYKGFMDVFYILTSVWKKNHKMCIWNWFFATCSADLSCVNGSRIQLVLYANCFLGLSYGFLNKNFQEVRLVIFHSSFIT